MPVISCPKCPTKLRVPDGASGNTKCPKCNTVFPVGAPAAAFEVVDETPASPPARSAPPPRPAAPPPRPAASPPPPPAAKSDFDFDDDDAPRKKRRRDDDEDDDDRPRRRRRDDDEEDDRPRSRRRRDEDDDDDRPRRKRGGRRRYDDDYDDDDDDEERWRSSGKKAAFGAAKTGVLLLNISFWMYFAVLALISLCLFLAWVGAFDGSSSSRAPRGGYGDDDFGSGGGGETLVKLIGITGLANWVVALVGFGFCIAGPARARGMAITATALAAAHLLLTGITVNNIGGGLFGRFSGGLGGGSWFCWTSMMPVIDVFLPGVIYGKGMFTGDFVFAFLAGVCELMRLIFALLMVKQLAIAAKDYDSAEKSQFGVIAAAIIAGASAAFALLVVVLLDAGITKSAKALMNIMMATVLLVYMGLTAMTVLPAIATNGARNSLARRARRG